MKLLPTTLFLALMLVSAPVLAARNSDAEIAASPAQNRLEIPGVETNVHLGEAASDDNGDYPNGRNNFRPKYDKNQGSVVPTLQKYICIGADCGCGGK
jgi:hypothetical protein